MNDWRKCGSVSSAFARAADARASGITLVAVTKVFPAAVIREAYEAGLREFGENYVQEFESKAPQVADLSGARLSPDRSFAIQ